MALLSGRILQCANTNLWDRVVPVFPMIESSKFHFAMVPENTVNDSTLMCGCVDFVPALGEVYWLLRVLLSLEKVQNRDVVDSLFQVLDNLYSFDLLLVAFNS